MAKYPCSQYEVVDIMKMMVMEVMEMLIMEMMMMTPSDT